MKNSVPNHVAIIMDGNGRWARRMGMPRKFGHYQGGLNMVRMASYANSIGLKNLTVFAFSTENWDRPQEEIEFLMTTPIAMVTKKYQAIISSNIKISFIGLRDRINKELLELMEKLELDTMNNTGLNFKIAIDYGAKEELLSSVKKMDLNNITITEIEQNLWLPLPVDLLIRTSGEMRISNFLIWQIAYAEIYFTKVHWPAFTKRQMDKALREYSKRNRRYGGL